MAETSETVSETEDLAALLVGRSRADVGALLGVSGQAVGQWLAGKKISGPTRAKIRELAAKLQKKRVGESPSRAPDPIPHVAALPPRSPPVLVHEPKLERELPGHDTALRLSAYRKALSNLDRAERILANMKDAAPRELAAIMGQVNGALNALGRVEPSAVKLLGSPEWAGVVKALEETLRGYPDVAAKVRDVFKRLDAESLADIQTALGPEL